VAHSSELRRLIRARHARLALGAWVNPFHAPERQVGYLVDDPASDFFLTQIVSHHQLEPVRRLVEQLERRGLDRPGAFGVFYYRSANPRTLSMLSRFIPVPAEEIRRDFEERGMTADEICARTIRELRALGVTRVYVSNLKPDDAPERLRAIRELVGD